MILSGIVFPLRKIEAEYIYARLPAPAVFRKYRRQAHQ